MTEPGCVASSPWPRFVVVGLLCGRRRGRRPTPRRPRLAAHPAHSRPPGPVRLEGAGCNRKHTVDLRRPHIGQSPPSRARRPARRVPVEGCGGVSRRAQPAAKAYREYRAGRSGSSQVAGEPAPGGGPRLFVRVARPWSAAPRGPEAGRAGFICPSASLSWFSEPELGRRSFEPSAHASGSPSGPGLAWCRGERRKRL